MSRGWLIDTNIVSEWVEPRPDAGIVNWLDEADEDRIFVSVVSLAEIRFGVDAAGSGASRQSIGPVASSAAAGALRGACRAGG